MEKKDMKSESQFKYYSLLRDEHKKDLGPVNIHWFEDLTQKAAESKVNSQKRGLVCNSQVTTNNVELILQNDDHTVFCEHQSISNQKLDDGDVTLGSFLGLTPVHTSQEQSQRCLFKTPGSVPKSHGKRLALSLGVDLHGANNVSWTSSLATPHGHMGTAKKVEEEEVEDNLSYTVGAARALFSPGVQQDVSHDDLAFGLNSTVDTESEEFLQSHQDKGFDLDSCVYKSTPLVQNKQTVNISERSNRALCTEHTASSSEETNDKGGLYEDVKDISTNDHTLVTVLDGEFSKSKSVENARQVFEDVLSIFVSPLTQNSQSSLRLSNRSLKRKLSMNDGCDSQTDSQKYSPNLSQHSSGSGYKKAKLSLSQPKRIIDSGKAFDKVSDVLLETERLSSNSAEDLVLGTAIVVTPTIPTETVAVSEVSKSVANEVVTEQVTPCKPAMIHSVSPAPDFFTQISPTSLSAMYEAAELPTSSLLGPTLDLVDSVTSREVGETTQNNNEPKEKIHGKHTNKNYFDLKEENEKKTTTKATSVKEDTQTRKTLAAKLHYVSPLFSSGKASKTPAVTPLKWKGQEFVGVKHTNNETSCDKKKVNTKPTESKSLGLRNRKAKRFSYPSTSQITDVCPQRVFQFEKLTDQDKSLTEMCTKKIATSLPPVNQSFLDQGGEVKPQKIPVLEPSCKSMGTDKNLGNSHDNENFKNNMASIKLKSRTFHQRRTAGFTTLTNYHTMNESHSLSSVSHCVEPKVKETRKNVQKMPEVEVKSLKSDQNVDDQCNMKPSKPDNNSLKNPHDIQKTTPSLVDAKSVVEDLSEDIGSLQGFTLASGNSVKLGSQSLERAKNMMEDIEEDLKMYFVQDGDKGQWGIAEGQTQGHNVKTDSSNSLMHNKSDQRNTEEMVCVDTAETQVSSNEFFVSSTGFQLASEKKVSISSKAELRAKGLMKEIEKDFLNENCAMGDKDTSVSGISLAGNCSSATSNVNLRSFDSNENNSAAGRQFVGFQSASGKNLKVSDKALKLANKLITEVDSGMESSDLFVKETKSCSNADNNSKRPIPVVGLQSASGKHIKISDKALDVANKLMLEVEDQVKASDGNEPGKTGPVTSGFQSASGKGLALSESSIHRAHLLMQQVDSELQASDTQVVILDHNLENLENTVKDLSIQGRQTSTNVWQHNQDRRSVPQGFRPFKPPMMSKLPAKMPNTTDRIERCPDVVFNSKNVSQGSDQAINSLNDNIKQVKAVLEQGKEVDTKRNDLPIEKREDFTIMSEREIVDKSSAYDGFTPTQIAEISEGTAVFLELDQNTQCAFQEAKENKNGPLCSVGESNNNTVLTPGIDCKHLDAIEVSCQAECNAKDSVEISRKSVQSANNFLEEEFSSELISVDVQPRDTKMVEDIEKREGCHTKDIFIDIIGIEGEPKLPDFVGFQTASGKRLKISEESLKQAQSVLEISSSDFQFEIVSKNNPNSSKLNTGSTKQHMEHCIEPVLKSEYDSMKHMLPEENRNSKLDDSVVPKMKESRIQESRYSCTLDYTKDVKLEEVFVVPQKICNISINRTVTASKLSLFCTDQNDSGCVDISGNISLTTEMQPSLGESSKQMDKSILQGSDGHPITQNPWESNLLHPDKSSSENKGKLENLNAADSITIYDNISVEGKFPGFQTASGKNVTVSEESLKKARDYLTEECCDTSETSTQKLLSKKCLDQASVGSDSHMEKSSDVTISRDKQNADTPPYYYGFQTASGNKVNVSKSALEAGKKMVHDETGNFGTVTVGRTCTQTINSCGFKTANGNDIFVSQGEDFNVVKNRWKDDKYLIQTDKSDHNGRETVETCGFQTAHDTKVSVSEKDIQAARKLLNNEVQLSENDKTVEICSKDIKSDGFAGGFQTASGYKVSISERALREGQKFLDEPKVVSDSITDTSKDSLPHNGFDQSCVTFGFQTASGNKVVVSDQALNAAKKLLHDDDTSSSSTVSNVTKDLNKGKLSSASGVRLEALAPEVKSNINSTDVSKADGRSCPSQKAEQVFSCGFQTARGTEVKISGNAIAKARKFLKDDSDVSQIEIPSYCPKQTPQLTFSCGFQTATGTKVNVSKEAIVKAKKFLHDDSDVSETHHPDYCTNQKPEQAFSCGFQTARGGKVKISEDAIAKAKKFLHDDSDVSETHNPDYSTNQEPEDAFLCCFQTTRGRKVNVSEEAIAKAKKFLHDDTNAAEAHARGNSPSQKPEDAVSFGSHTAKGAKVKISENAITNAKKFLNDVSETQFTGNCPSKKSEQAFSCGFQTARGGKVNVSGEAIAKAKKFLNEESLMYEHSDNSADEIPTKGRDRVDKFEANRKKQLNDEGVKSSCDDPPMKSDIGTFTGGFQTAHGSKVKISDTALKAAKKCLDEEDRSDVVTNSKSSDLHKNKSVRFSSGLQKAHDAEGTAESEKAVNVPGTLLAGEKSILSARKDQGNNAGTIIGGFQTASGTELNVSKKAIETAKRMFSEEDNIGVIRHEYQSKTSSNGRETDHKNSASFQEKSTSVTLSLTQEAAASAKALVEDGDFDDWLIQGKSDTLNKPWMRSCSTSPESYVADRRHSTVSPKPTSLVTVPAKDVPSTTPDAAMEKYRWKGPTLCKYSNNEASPSSDRKTFVSQHQIQSTPNATGGRSGRSPHLQSVLSVAKTKGILDSNRARFNTPTKKEMESDTTPSKQVLVEGTAFVTPFKKSEEMSFKTPVKKTPEKCKDDLETAEDPVMSDLAMLEKLMSDENAPEELDAVQKTTQQVRMTVSSDVKKARLKAKVAQAQRIKCKRQQCNTRPVMGKLTKEKKCTQRISMKDVVGPELRPRHYSNKELYSYGVHQSTLQVNSETAEGFRFKVSDYYNITTAMEKEGILVGDGVLLVMDENSTVGKEEFCNALLDMEGVEPKLISRDWVFNHYRWIVWKLTAYEVALPQHFASRCLKPDQVMLQLKYRYDREIDHSQRSALKKIFEKDDSPQKCMVLCVSRIIAINDNRIQNSTNKVSTGVFLELTDTWYPIRALVDHQLARCVTQGRLNIGDKIMVYGAELLGSQDGCLPLKAPADVMLKICTNSTRRVAWYTRLGYRSNPQPPPLSLVSLYPDGGIVGCVDVVITRVYPTQYLEKHANGSSTFRSERAEDKAQKSFEKKKQYQQEAVYARLQNEFEQRMVQKDTKSGGKKQWSRKEVSELETECEVYEAYSTAADTTDFMGLLSTRQKFLLENYKSKVFDDRQADIQADFQKKLLEARDEIPSRNVTPLLKIRVAGCANADIDTDSGSVYTVWRPTEEVMSLLQEGQRLLMYNVMATELRGKQQSTGRCRSGLTATRTTRYQRLDIDDNLLDLVYEPREVISLAELTDKLKPSCGEVDIVGLVISIVTSNHYQGFGGGDAQNTTVYLADSEAQFVAVKFWGGLSVFGVEDILKTGMCFASTNLTYRDDYTYRVPGLLASEVSVFTTNPKGRYLKIALERLQQTIQKDSDFMSRCQDQLHQLMTESELIKSASKLTAGTSLNTPNMGRYHKSGNVSVGSLSKSLGDTIKDSLQNGSSHRDSTMLMAPNDLLSKQNGRGFNSLVVDAQKTDTFTKKQDRLRTPVKTGEHSREAGTLNPSSTCSSTENPVSKQDSCSLNVTNKNSIQKSKAEKLESFIENMVHMSPGLHFTPSPKVTVAKACKPPGLRRRSLKGAQHDKAIASHVKEVVPQKEECIPSPKVVNNMPQKENKPNMDFNNVVRDESSNATLGCCQETSKDSITVDVLTSVDVSTDKTNINVDSSNVRQRKGKRKQSTEQSDEKVENGKRRKSLRLFRQK